MLKDRYGRIITNLRIAITNRCNLRCFYCHREGEKNPEGEISAERIVEIAKAFYELGIKKLKITGGEPLLRKDLFEILQNLPDFKEVSITTNGTLLADKAYELKECGLDRVNVSLDTLNAEKYRFITGGNIERVLDGIEQACNADLTPMKVNMVVLRGINDSEVDEMLRFVSSFNRRGVKAILQVIELLRTPELERYYYDISKIEKRFAKEAYAVKIRSMHRRRQYWLERGVIEFVKPDCEFCMNCNRIRVTSDGKIKPCLMSNETIDITGLHGRDLINAIKRAVMLRKPYFCEIQSQSSSFSSKL